ncbi:MAG TPA: MFS transporter [Candidatus Limnocylindria bacterium]|nr:MFS transporter [Candidatus Limnocylindria bacterium]
MRDSDAAIAAPGRRTATQARNWSLVQADSIYIGIVTAAGTFLPVFLLRLGATGNDIGLLTALPALTAFGLAIPLGRWLQRRRNIVPWYSRMRLLAWSSYALMAAAATLLSREQAIPAILAIWGLASLPSTAGLVAFPIVMDGAAGRDGRFDLLGRRWAIAGLATAISVAVGGQFLNAVAFPTNFELLLVCISIAGVGSYLQSSRIVIPDQVRAPAIPAGRVRAVSSGVEARAGAPGAGPHGLWRLVLGNRGFVRYELQALLYTASIGISMPILPLFYVHELNAPDAWIGIIGSATSAGGVLGYLVARRLARRRGGAGTLLPALLAMAIAPAILSVVGWLPAVAAIGFVIGIAGAGAQLALFDAFMRRVPSENGVTFSSVDQSIQNFALIIAPNIGGLLTVALGARTSLIVVAGVGLAAFGAFAWGNRAAGRPATAGGSVAGPTTAGPASATAATSGSTSTAGPTARPAAD